MHSEIFGLILCKKLAAQFFCWGKILKWLKFIVLNFSPPPPFEFESDCRLLWKICVNRFKSDDGLLFHVCHLQPNRISSQPTPPPLPPPPRATLPPARFTPPYTCTLIFEVIAINVYISPAHYNSQNALARGQYSPFWKETGALTCESWKRDWFFKWKSSGAILSIVR